MGATHEQLIVFDFDWQVLFAFSKLFIHIIYTKSRSMADQDTDRWIFEVNAPDLRRKMKNLKDDVQWTDLV
jgi:pyridoxal phosphate phosphatase PHOSPHO2